MAEVETIKGTNGDHQRAIKRESLVRTVHDPHSPPPAGDRGARFLVVNDRTIFHVRLFIAGRRAIGFPLDTVPHRVIIFKYDFGIIFKYDFETSRIRAVRFLFETGERKA
jgi:hypothetical protein